jgi:hypothetical protein
MAKGKRRAQWQHEDLLNETWTLISDDFYLAHIDHLERRETVLNFEGCKRSADVEYLTEEAVGALGSLMKPAPRKRLQRAWADLRAIQDA